MIKIILVAVALLFNAGVQAGIVGSGLAFCFLSAALQFSDATHQTEPVSWQDLYGWNLPVRFTISPAAVMSAKPSMLTIPISSCF